MNGASSAVRWGSPHCPGDAEFAPSWAKTASSADQLPHKLPLSAEPATEMGSVRRVSRGDCVSHPPEEEKEILKEKAHQIGGLSGRLLMWLGRRDSNPQLLP